MCGIWAVFGSDDDVDVQCNAVHKIRHRGPEAFRIENIHFFQNCCLGFHRLSIVDDLRGMQPLRLYTHPYIYLVYNGEIYNHKRLDKEFGLTTTTEVDGEPIIHLYGKYGAKAMAEQLDGVFAFCIMDTKNRKVILGRDTYGVRPLFRFHTAEGFLAVCSEAKGLFGLSHKLTDDEINVEEFPPGHIEIYTLDDKNCAHLEERIQFNKPGQPPKYKTLVDPKSLSHHVKENVATLLEAAVKKRLMAERRIGCFLSGGLDSSLVAALTVRLTKQYIKEKMQTFAIGMEGSPDLIAAKKVADYLDTEHHEVIMTQEEALKAIDKVVYHLESYDITTVRASVGMFLLSKYVKTKTDTVVLLSGEGSDEVAQGYIYFHQAPTAEAAHEESLRLVNDLYMYDVLRGDRATAAWGLEVRVPFLDHQFSSYYLSIDPELKRPRDGVEKHLLRSAFSEALLFPKGDAVVDNGTSTKPLLPEEILWRPKEAFSDGVSSSTRSWYQVIQDHLETQIKDSELKEAASLYPHNTPKTKEALYYRRIFEKYYPNRGKWIPYFWMPKWSTSDDPSARTLKHYKQ